MTCRHRCRRPDNRRQTPSSRRSHVRSGRTWADRPDAICPRSRCRSRSSGRTRQSSAWTSSGRSRRLARPPLRGRTDGDAPGHERGAASGATCLTIPTCEHGPFLGDAIDVRGRMAEVRAAAIGPEIVPACVVVISMTMFGRFSCAEASVVIGEDIEIAAPSASALTDAIYFRVNTIRLPPRQPIQSRAPAGTLTRVQFS